MEGKIIALLKSAAEGNKDDFRAFAQLVGKRIMTIAQRVLRDKMYAEDVFNTVLTKVWQNLDKIVKLDNPTGYINTIAYNASIDIARKNKELPLFENLPDSNKDYDAKIDVTTALAALSEEERLIVIYNVHAGYSFKKIGELLGLTKKAVYLRYQKAIKTLKRRLT